MCAYNVRVRAFGGCCGCLFVREPMEGVNGLYLRVSGVFLYVVGVPFVAFPFFFITFFFIRVRVCVQVYMWRVYVTRSYMVSRALVW